MAANLNVTQLTQQTGTAAPTSLFYAVTTGSTDTGLPLSVLVNSLGLTGTPTTPTATTGTNTTQIASCAFVQAQVTSQLSPYAQLASPTFTGTVTIPTITLSGGTINSTSVGATTPSTGAFTTLSTTGNANLSAMQSSSVTITGGSINSTAIGATTASTGKFTALQATGAFTPSTTSGIVGTTLGDNATAGSVGEFISSTSTSTGITSATVTNITSITLSPGDWDVFGHILFSTAAGTTATVFLSAINSASATLPAAPLYTQHVVSVPANSAYSEQPPMTRFNISGATTIFLVGEAVFSGGTCSTQGILYARRRR